MLFIRIILVYERKHGDARRAAARKTACQSAFFVHLHTRVSMERPPLMRYLEWTPGAAPAGPGGSVARSNASAVVGVMKEAAGRAFHAKVRVVLGIADIGASLLCLRVRTRAGAGSCGVCVAQRRPEWQSLTLLFGGCAALTVARRRRVGRRVGRGRD
jgi:hypothetical protein